MAKLHVHIIKREELKYDLIALSEDKITWYKIPNELQELSQHKELFESKTIVNSITSIAKNGGYRKVTIPFSQELQRKYLDQDGNFCMNEHYLEEYSINEKVSTRDETDNNAEVFLLKRIKELEAQISSINEISLIDIEKKFLLNKFNGKQEPLSWINSFEKECIRYNISNNTKKVEALKFFLEGNVLEWYSSNLVKLALSDWDSWKHSFLLVYEKKDWASIRMAFNFKYIGGSLTDFAIKKERLLLDADEDMEEKFRIYQIVFSLPIDIQDRLERGKINSFYDLLDELKKCSVFSLKKKQAEKSSEERKKFEASKIFDSRKKPCSICEELGFKSRFHPTQLCRNKDFKLKLTNLTEGSEEEYREIEKN